MKLTLHWEIFIFLILWLPATNAQRSCCADRVFGCSSTQSHGCKMCLGDYVRRCNDGLWEHADCGIGLICVQGSNSCEVQCVDRSATAGVGGKDMPKISSSAPKLTPITPIESFPNACGENKPDGCRECQGDSIKKCTNGSWETVNSCDQGLTCIPGASWCETACIGSGNGNAPIPDSPSNVELASSSPSRVDQVDVRLTDSNNTIVEKKFFSLDVPKAHFTYDRNKPYCDDAHPTDCEICMFSGSILHCDMGTWSEINCPRGSECKSRGEWCTAECHSR